MCFYWFDHQPWHTQWPQTCLSINMKSILPDVFWQIAWRNTNIVNWWFHRKPLAKPFDLSCNWFKACWELLYNNKIPHHHSPNKASGVVKYQCCRTTIINYLVGCSAVDRKEQGRYQVLEIVASTVLRFWYL